MIGLMMFTNSGLLLLSLNEPPGTEIVGKEEEELVAGFLSAVSRYFSDRFGKINMIITDNYIIFVEKLGPITTVVYTAINGRDAAAIEKILDMHYEFLQNLKDLLKAHPGFGIIKRRYENTDGYRKISDNVEYHIIAPIVGHIRRDIRKLMEDLLNNLIIITEERGKISGISNIFD